MQLTVHDTDTFNPGQSPVLGADQPLFAIAKQLQWALPDILGEEKLVLMIKALHIEDKMHQMIGKQLKDSGWSNIITQAQVLTCGRAQYVPDEHHIKRTRYAHQVSLVSLYLLQQRSYTVYCSSVQGPPESPEMWIQRCRSDNPMFLFWATIMDLELLMCRFIRSLREGDFPLYLQVCDKLCSSFHVMDLTNYARWLPVYVRDMVQLPQKHPQLYAEFLKGNFFVQRSAHKFSLISKDQGHGGAVGLFENPEALALFMLAGPDCTRCIEEFETVLHITTSGTAHHEEASALQTKFRTDVLAFVEAAEHLGNPFNSGTELVALHTQEVMEKGGYFSHPATRPACPVCVTYYTAGNFAHNQHSEMPECLHLYQQSCYTGTGSKAGSAQRNSCLIMKLFLSLQSRPDADMEEFFRYENLPPIYSPAPQKPRRIGSSGTGLRSR